MESCYKSVEEAVDDIFIQIYPKILNDDYSIFGHSMGSLLAYELYYKIRSEGCRMPSHMFFSGLGSPKKIQYAPKYAGFSDREFEHKIMEMGGTPQEVLECEEFMDFFRPILRGDFSMIEKYVFKPQKLGIKCNTAVLVGKEDVKYCDGIEEWDELIDSNISYYEFEGGHFYFNANKAELGHVLNTEILICRLCLDWLGLAIMLALDSRQFLMCGSQKDG